MIRSINCRIFWSGFLFFPVFLLVLASGELYAQNSPAHEEEQIDFATGLFQRGFYDMSISEYQKYLEAYKEGKFVQQSYLGIGENLYFKGDYPAALEAYQKYIQLFEKGDFVYVVFLRLGEIYYLTQQYDKAAPYFDRVHEDNLEGLLRQTRYYYLAKNQLALGLKDDAVKNFTAATKVSGQTQFTASAFLELGDLMLKDQKYKEALENYTKINEQALTDEMKMTGLEKQGEVLYLMENFNNAIPLFERVVQAYVQQGVQYEALANLLLSHYQLKQFDVVIKIFQEKEPSFEALPQVVSINYTAAGAYDELGQSENALEIIDKTIAFPFVNPEERYRGNLKRAEILIHLKQFEQALKVLENDTQPVGGDDLQLQFLKAQALSGLTQYDKSIEMYKNITANNKQKEFADDVLYALAYSQKNAGRNDEAAANFEQYIQNGKDDAKKEESLYNLILLYKDGGKVKKAIEAAQKYLSKYGGNPDIEKIQFLLADLYSSDGQYELSDKAIHQYLEQFPEGSNRQAVGFLSGFNKQSQKKFEEALKYYADVKADQEDRRYQLTAQKNMAVIYLEQDKPEEAASVYDRLITDIGGDVVNAKTYFWICQLYLKKERYDDVLRVLSQLEKIPDLSPENKAGLAYFSAEAYRFLKDCKKAAQYYDQVLGNNDGRAFKSRTYLGEGRCFIDDKNWDQAKDMLTKAIESNADDFTTGLKARMALAEIETALGHDEEAVKYYLLVAVLYKDDAIVPQALFNAGGILEKLKRLDEAVKTYEEIVDNYPKASLKQTALERIKALKQK